jgi:hypothetical protein
MRTSGVLMPISSLPSPYGIGTMGKSARKFVDFLADSADLSDQLRRFTVSVVFQFCGKSVLYRSGHSLQGKFIKEKGM